MVALRDFLMLEKGVKSGDTAKTLISEGFVKIDRQTIKDEYFPVSKGDNVIITEKRLAEIHPAYWKFRDLQEKKGLFKKDDDALCVSLEQGELEFLSDSFVEVHAVVPYEQVTPFLEEAQMEIFYGDIFSADLSGRLKSKVDMLLIGANADPLRLIGLLEHYLPHLKKDGLALVKINMRGRELSDIKNIVATFSGKLGIEALEYLELKHSKEEVWVLLRKEE